MDESVQNLKAERLLKEFIARHRAKHDIELHPERLMRIRLLDPKLSPVATPGTDEGRLPAEAAPLARARPAAGISAGAARRRRARGGGGRHAPARASAAPGHADAPVGRVHRDEPPGPAPHEDVVAAARVARLGHSMHTGWRAPSSPQRRCLNSSRAKQ